MNLGSTVLYIILWLSKDNKTAFTSSWGRGSWEINILCSLTFLLLGLLPITRDMNSMQLSFKKIRWMKRSSDWIPSMKGQQVILGAALLEVGVGSAMSTGSSLGWAVKDMFPGWIVRRTSKYPSIPHRMQNADFEERAWVEDRGLTRGRMGVAAA